MGPERTQMDHISVINQTRQIDNLLPIVDLENKNFA